MCASSQTSAKAGSSPIRPSKLLLRSILRPPYVLLRLGLLGCERLLGQEWIAITTTGRRTGKPHTVLLDLVGLDRTTGRHYVQPGWPRGSDWVRNVEANPRVEARVGRRRFEGRVVRVPGPEGAEWAYRFGRKHPIGSMLIGRLILGWRPPTGDEATVKEWMARHLVFYAVDPADRRPG